MTAVRALSLVVLALFSAALLGCGEKSDEKKAATRPAALFKEPPSGLTYKAPDAATEKRVKDLLTKSGDLSGDDVAVRQVLQKGGLGQPIAVGVAVDTHLSGDPGDALKGFTDGAKDQTGEEPQSEVIAGTKTTLAKLSGTVVTAGEKNGYLVEAIAPDTDTAQKVLKRLIVAAGEATR